MWARCGPNVCYVCGVSYVLHVVMLIIIVFIILNINTTANTKAHRETWIRTSESNIQRN